MRNHRDGEYLITYRPVKALLIFALPILIGNIFQQVYQMMDSIVVGRLVSQNALAAIGASAALTNIFICLATGAGLGASVLTSRYFGARDYKKMKQIISTSLICFLIFSILMGMFGFLFSRELLFLLNTPDEVLDMASLYLRVYFAGFPFLFMYNVLSSTFNALGRSQVPLFMLIFSSLLNVVLDLFMVGPLQMGVFGAALATLIAQGLSAVFSFLLLIRELGTYQSEPFALFCGGEAKEMLTLAIPSMIQQSTVAVGMLLVQSVVNSFGAEALAGYSAAVRVENIAFVPLTAMASALSSYVAQNLGAGQKKRIIEGYRAYGYPFCGRNSDPYGSFSGQTGKSLHRKRRNADGEGDSRWLYEFSGIFLFDFGNEDLSRFCAEGNGLCKGIFDCQPCKSGYSGGDSLCFCAYNGNTDYLAGGSGGMDGRIFNFFYGLQKEEKATFDIEESRFLI